VKVRKGELSTVKMSVVPQVVLLLPGTSSSPRPISYQEESYPEASPPRGGPPESPNEVECLKIEAPGNSHQLGYCELQQGGTNDPDESPKPALLQLSQGKRHR
jgi:hypothetical protein